MQTDCGALTRATRIVADVRGHRPAFERRVQQQGQCLANLKAGNVVKQRKTYTDRSIDPQVLVSKNVNVTHSGIRMGHATTALDLGGQRIEGAAF